MDQAHAIRGALIAEALIDWFERAHRDLPWRRTKDPYAIWVSEIMLQQTRVETVIPYYERWMAHFPTVQSLAAAPLDDVLAHWAGLGYYSRARNLHRAAKQVADLAGGRLPRTAEALRALPGIGRYTAGAIASIAFDKSEPLVDGNVERVLARLCLTANRDEAWATARALVPEGSKASSFNQGLMELGAMICTKRSPSCASCPLESLCEARARGIEEEVPPSRRHRTIPEIDAAVALLERHGRLLLLRRPPSGLWGGLWEFPTVELEAGETPAEGARRASRSRTGLSTRLGPLCGVVEHGLTHRHMRFHVFAAKVTGGRVRLGGYEAHRWLRQEQIAGAAISSATQRMLAFS